MSNDYILSNPIWIYDFRDWKWLNDNDLHIVFQKDHFTGGHMHYDDIFSLRHHAGVASKYATVYVKGKYVTGFTIGGDPTDNDILDIIQHVFNVKCNSCDYQLQNLN